MGILTLISSQRHPKMDSEGDSEFEEKNGRKILGKSYAYRPPKSIH